MTPAEGVGAATRVLVALLAGLVLALALHAARADERPAPPVQVTRPEPLEVDVEWVDVRQVDDVGKAGTARSVIVQRFFGIEAWTCGTSGDQQRIRFDAPVEVTGVDISVDIGPRLNLVEVMAAANAEQGYGRKRHADPLAHTSWTNGGDWAIDKATALPAPISLPAGGHVTIGAWLCANSAAGKVSPEVIVHYRWV